MIGTNVSDVVIAGQTKGFYHPGGNVIPLSLIFSAGTPQDGHRMGEFNFAQDMSFLCRHPTSPHHRCCSTSDCR